MLAIKVTLAILGILVVLQTALSFVQSREWWVRIFVFPRAQIAFGSLVVLALFALANLGLEEAAAWERVLFALIAIAVAVQAWQMLPYTPMWKHQVPTAPAGISEENRLRLVISNVRMGNREFERWHEGVRAENPDVIVTVEVDDWWDRKLDVFESEYPHQLRQPQDNTYGMSLYSRFPLHDCRIKRLLESDVPSIFASIELRSGRRVRCIVLHPRPPRPDIQQDSDLRDAELVRAGRIVGDFQSPVIVAGDLNDVAWSRSTHLFQRIARVLDPRIGRGLYATYHADHRFLRWPLDHVFHTNHFDVVALRRLRHVGSDHFPICIELVLRPDDGDRPDAPAKEDGDEQQAIDAVQDARDLREDETQRERRERKRADQ